MKNLEMGLLLGKMFLPQVKTKQEREPRFECLWYTADGDTQTKCFYTRKQALAFYEAHKNDTDYNNWWVTHRDADWDVLEDIIG